MLEMLDQVQLSSNFSMHTELSIAIFEYSISIWL